MIKTSTKDFFVLEVPTKKRCVNWTPIMIRRITIASILVLAGTLFAHSAEGDEEYLVWFHPSFNIESVEDVERKLAGTIPSYYGNREFRFFGGEPVVVAMWLHEAFTFEDLNNAEIDERVPMEHVETCAEFILWADQDYWPIASIEHGTVRHARVHDRRQALRNRLQYCRDIAILATAGPATQSHIRGYFLEEIAPKELFELFCDVPSPPGCEDFNYERNRQHFSIDYGMPRDYKHDRASAGLDVRLLALADFDEDGIEDMIIAAWRRVIDGDLIPNLEMSTYRLSRNGRDGPLIVSLLHHSY